MKRLTIAEDVVTRRGTSTCVLTINDVLSYRFTGTRTVQTGLVSSDDHTGKGVSSYYRNQHRKIGSLACLTEKEK